ncbi:unnamed protein product [Miscanthus lutarioriparius]|uniref:Uncharacterized protein n=1 Tax=Miscanthus lutarioriparius TaxID=422564 RepID=A0A811N9A6_9POAL|nr:unnamed protein product [Miscanthus lutarioriparius]
MASVQTEVPGSFLPAAAVVTLEPSFCRLALAVTAAAKRSMQALRAAASARQFLPLSWLRGPCLRCVFRIPTSIRERFGLWQTQCTGGLVATAELMPEVLRAEAALATDVVAAAAPAVVAGPMRWNNNTSGFVLRRMAQLLSDGTRPNKVFKDKDVNHVAKCLKDYSGDAMSPTQDHPKAAEFLNCPIRFYPKMEAIFGHSMAIDRYALGSGKALREKTNTKVGEGSKAIELLQSTMGGKRKRGNFTEDEMLMLTNMSDVVNNVANALRETGPAHVDANLYLAVMETPSFSKEALIVAYTYLLDNKTQGRGFVGMTESNRDIWLKNYLAKNNYM